MTKCSFKWQTERPESITISPSGKFFGIQSKHKLLIWKVPATDSNHAAVKKISLHHTKNLEILAFHPTSRIVAAGDESGRILIWRGFGRRTFPIGDKLENGRLVHHEEERPGVRGDDDADSCSTWHWHATQVNVLSFSSDGAYLYSGKRNITIFTAEQFEVKRSWNVLMMIFFYGCFYTVIGVEYCF